MRGGELFKDDAEADAVRFGESNIDADAARGGESNINADAGRFGDLERNLESVRVRLGERLRFGLFLRDRFIKGTYDRFISRNVILPNARLHRPISE